MTVLSSEASEWWQEWDRRGEVVQALAHLREAAHIRSQESASLEYCGYQLDALNSLWSAYRRYVGEPDASDYQGLRDLLVDGIPLDRRSRLLRSDAVRALAQFSPSVLDHDVIRRWPQYRPGAELPEELVQRAASKHAQFARAHARWQESSSPETETAALKKVAQLIQVIRSNLRHGEKTPRGPDMAKAERDRTVATVTRNVLDHLFEALFAWPGTRLAVYGTLAPGGANHSIVEDVPGDWSEGTINGRIFGVEGLPIFEWETGEGPVPIWLLTSMDLPKLWRTLDTFEGPGYVRHLIPVELSDKLVVANIFAKAQDW